MKAAWSLFRLRHGLHWRGQFPIPSRAEVFQFMAGVIAAVVLILLYALTDYSERVVQAEIDAKRAVATLMDCMNGTARFVSADQKEAVVCEKAWSMKL